MGTVRRKQLYLIDFYNKQQKVVVLYEKFLQHSVWFNFHIISSLNFDLTIIFRKDYTRR